MRVALSVGSLAAHTGGPSRTVPALGEALAAGGVSTLLFACANASPPRVPDNTLVKTHLIDCGRRGERGALVAPFRRTLRREAEIHGTEILHDNGVWLATNHVAVGVGRELSLPIVISPRGMLEPWSIGHRAWKKKLAWLAYQARDLRAATVLHATSEMEAENLRALGLHQPIAIIPNGVETPATTAGRTRARTGAPRTALFLSRIHPKKGLLNLVSAWNVVRPKGWRMIVAGPDEGGHRAEVERAVRSARIEGDFQFIGAVDGADKWNLIQNASLFVLPTHSENFGVAIAEALVAGVPAITTRGAPWPQLTTMQCGWWIDIGVDPLVAALREATELDEHELLGMGQRGREWAQRTFSWPAIADQMRRVYEWILGRSSPPECVLTA